MPAPRRHTEKEWRALSASRRRRIETANDRAQALRDKGVPARGYDKSDWLAGEPMPRELQGHRLTPSHGAAEASRNPQKYPRYMAKRRNLEAVNEYRREQAQRNVRNAKPEIGHGPRGRQMPTQFTVAEEAAWGPYTDVIRGAPLDNYHTGTRVFTDVQTAQNYARESGAPPGVVVIRDNEDGTYDVLWVDYEEKAA